MHGDVSTGVMPVVDFKPVSYGLAVPDEKDEGYVPPTGELDPDYAAPIGDVLLPLMLMACVYAIVRFFKNRKLQKSINNQ
jgi:hypothetical protein